MTMHKAGRNDKGAAISESSAAYNFAQKKYSDILGNWLPLREMAINNTTQVKYLPLSFVCTRKLKDSEAC